MSAITDEITRVLQNQKPSKPLTASEIYDAGSFDEIQPVYVALSTMASKADGRLLRNAPINGGKYAYSINSQPGKNGVVVAEHVLAKAAGSIMEVFHYEGAKEAAAQVIKILRAVGKPVYLWIRKDGRIKVAGENYGAGPDETLIGSYLPEVAAADLEGDILEARAAASGPVNGASHAAVERPKPEKNVAAAQPGRVTRTAPSQEGHAAGAAPAAAPVAPKADEIARAARAAPGQPATIVSDILPATRQEALAETGTLSGVSLTAWRGDDPDFNHPINVEVDPLFAALILRLPFDNQRWTKAQREGWQHAFSAAADFIYPESK